MSKGPTGPLYRLQFEHFPDHLYVYIHAPRLTEAVVRSYLREVADEAAKAGHRRILIVRDIEDSLSDVVNYNLSQTTSEWLKGVKVAWVNPHPTQQAAMQFFIDVASNRGSHYKLFTNVDAARKWLLR